MYIMNIGYYQLFLSFLSPFSLIHHSHVQGGNKKRSKSSLVPTPTEHVCPRCKTPECEVVIRRSPTTDAKAGSQYTIVGKKRGYFCK